jgi:hypothetical protein
MEIGEARRGAAGKASPIAGPARRLRHLQVLEVLRHVAERFRPLLPQLARLCDSHRNP